ncbi:MAG TPA: maleylpyruvate isomerase N-terminal domain-containing protein, partial [Acidimicrobiales bacterium]|nr:maleylpyruvate isomerase N-terminal domain-containing protein [Acidimicrobiales bacterium]
VDHVREVLFGMRFALDSAIGQPGIDLGEPPEPRFHSEPRRIDAVAASDGLDREARALVDRLSELSPEAWTAWATVGGQRVDAHWVVRHALHDATHHLLDVERLRAAP